MDAKMTQGFVLSPDLSAKARVTRVQVKRIFAGVEFV
jgi:hypothetical protein